MLRDALGLGALIFATGTCAQVSVTLSAVSDYRFRGLSLSDDKPAAQLGLAYDHPSGWYAGAFASTVRLASHSSGHLQLLSYGGYAQRIGDGLHWELGGLYSAFPGTRGHDYAEIYGGFGSDAVSGRLHYAQDYFGLRRGALYAEVNGVHALTDRWHLSTHAGVLRLAGAEGGSDRYRLDLRAGIVVELDLASLQLAWVASDGEGAAVYPLSENRHPRAWVLSASRAF